jgi:hypothetical protein
MVATHRNNPDVFEQPLTLTIAGREYTLTSHEAVIRTIRELDRQEMSLNRQAAMAAFALGMMLIKAGEALEYGSLSHLYNECGIHRRKAQRCIRFAKHYAKDDGSMNLDLYRQAECKARNNHEQGTHRCSFDKEDKPSMKAVMIADGLESATSTGCDTRVATSGVPAYRSPAEALAEFAPTPPAPVDRPPRGTGGGQLVMDFDLLATERRLARAVEQIQAAMERGALSSEQGSRVNDSLERVCSDAQNILEHAKG